MQRHEVQLRGAESSGGGGWGRTASALPRGCVRVVWRRCPVPLSRQRGTSQHGRPQGSPRRFDRQTQWGRAIVGDGLVPSR